jgi:hypothetical protein
VIRRLLAVVAAGAVAVAAGLTTTARADGDPASDVLYFQDVFLPYTAPSADLAAELKAAVTASNKAGIRLKVAVVGTEQDLGSVPSLFNQQSLYARFLGIELRTFYSHRLLVVMPAGFGIYNNGLSVTKETEALGELKIDSPDSDGLTKAAIDAVAKLRDAVGQTASKDVTAPAVKALAATGSKGKKVTLRYTVFDAGGRSREVVRVYGPAYLLFATILKPFAKAKPKRSSSAVWKVPRNIETTKLRFCVLAQDPAGNQRTSCARLKIV